MASRLDLPTVSSNQEPAKAALQSEKENKTFVSLSAQCSICLEQVIVLVALSGLHPAILVKPFSIHHDAMAQSLEQLFHRLQQ